jgi:predicted dehydrogenase
MVGICSHSGFKASHSGTKFGFRYSTSDENEIITDPEINTVVIATRHNRHASEVINALNADKSVFCEKPLCMNREELSAITRAFQKTTSQFLMVGYNRRFSAMARQLKAFVAQSREPMMMCYRVNAGHIPHGHWTQDPELGGGRIIGEVCHFIDFMIYLCGALPVRVYGQMLPNGSRYCDDNVAITVEFSDYSIGTIAYTANGNKSLAKERFEVFTGGMAGVLDDFRRLELWRDGRKHITRSMFRQDKGHREEWEALVSAVRIGAPAPISFDEIVSTSLATFGIIESLRCRQPVVLDTEALLESAAQTQTEHADLAVRGAS